jgi:fumarate hydratase class II
MEPFVGALIVVTWIFFVAWAIPKHPQKIAYVAPSLVHTVPAGPSLIGTPEERFTEARFTALTQKVAAIEDLLNASLVRIETLEKQIADAKARMLKRQAEAELKNVRRERVRQKKEDETIEEGFPFELYLNDKSVPTPTPAPK